MLTNNQRRLISIGKMFSYDGELCSECGYDLDTDTKDPIQRKMSELKEWIFDKSKYYCIDCYEKSNKKNL